MRGERSESGQQDVRRARIHTSSYRVHANHKISTIADGCICVASGDKVRDVPGLILTVR